MVRDSIEAKGDEDVDMEDAPATMNGDGERASTAGADISQVDGAADGNLVTRSVTRSSTNRDGDADTSVNGEGADEEAQKAQPGRRRRAPDTPQKRLLDLIDTTSKYLCSYQEG